MIHRPYLTTSCRRLLLLSHPACFYLVLGVLVPSILLYSQPTQISGAQTRIMTNVQTGVSYTLQTSDCGKLISLSNTSAIAVTIPEAGVAGGLSAGCWMDIQNTGSGAATLTATGTPIDGVSSVVLTSNQGLRLISSGAAYYTQRGQGSAWTGTLTVQSDGSPIGATSAINVVSGTGVECIPQVNNGVMALQCNADTSYLASKPSLQSASNPQICTSASGSGTTYTAACATSLNAYAAKQTLFWYTDASNTSTTPTLNIDTLGAMPLVRQDGTAPAIGDIQAAVLYRIWYDGAKIHVVEAGLGSSSSSGGTTVDSGGGSAASTYYVCFNFRATAAGGNNSIPAGGDGACTYVLGASTPYPTTVTVNGIPVTFGWESGVLGVSARDRYAVGVAGMDVRLSGMNFVANAGTTPAVFRVNLPLPGIYSYRWAMGDPGNSTCSNNTTVMDTDTVIKTLSVTAVDGSYGQDTDPNGIPWATPWQPAAGQPTSWLTSNTAAYGTWATTIFRLAMGGVGGSANSCLQHLAISSVPGASF